MEQGSERVEHSSGKWAASKSYNFTGTFVSYITSGEKVIAQTRLSNTDSTVEENDANARLIEQSPNMIKALKECTVALDKMWLSPEAQRVYLNARQIIEAATREK